MTENMAGRGEGLAGLREAQIAMRDACFRDMLKLIKDCHADVPHGATGKLALTVLYDSIEHQGVEGFGAALEAAAPAGTPRTITKINDYGVLIREVEQAQDLLKKVWDQLFYCERERDELGRALATPSPQAPASTEPKCSKSDSEFAAERLAAIPGDVDTLISRAIYGESVADVRRKVAGYLERALSLSSPIEPPQPLHQRAWDLIRHQRMELHAARLITDEEYAALARDHNAVYRLENYDKVMAQASSEIRELPAKWRKKAEAKTGSRYAGPMAAAGAMRDCADELDTALAPSRQGAAKIVEG